MNTLLCPSDGAPFLMKNPDGASRILFVCEHASNMVPESLNNLGLTDDQLLNHVAWDPGAVLLAHRLSNSLDTAVVSATFSQLIYDCNRPPEAPSAMSYDTEAFPIPGNRALTETQRNARVEDIYRPFHRAVADQLEIMVRKRLQPIVLTIHSFTPIYNGISRAVEIGYLHGDDQRLADAKIAVETEAGGLDIQRNQPYGPTDGVLHTVQLHGENKQFPYLMIENRNDLLADESGLNRIHSHLHGAIREAVSLPNLLK